MASDLIARESVVLACIAQGRSNRVAEELHRGKTVRIQVLSGLEKWEPATARSRRSSLLIEVLSIWIENSDTHRGLS